MANLTNTKRIENLEEEMTNLNSKLDTLIALMSNGSTPQNNQRGANIPQDTPQSFIKTEVVYEAVNHQTKNIKVYTVAGKSGKDNSSIRVWFASKPSATVLASLKAVGYKYYNPTKEWYAHNTEKARETAREIATKIK